MGFLSLWLESLDYRVTISNACLRSRSLHSNCQICLTACPKSAIIMTNGKVEIDNGVCNDCGECLVSCPMHAIEGILPKRAVVGTALLFSEEYVPSETELLVFHAKGIQIIAIQGESLNERWESVVKRANEMLEQLNKLPFQIESRFQLEELFTRRQLFSLWKSKGKSVLADLLPAQLRYNHNDLDLKTHYPDYQFFNIEIRPEKCTLCQACIFICPNQCIQVSEEKMSLELAECINCKLCTDVCPEQAIIVNRQISLKQDIQLNVMQKNCVQCGSVFSTLDPNAKLCIFCMKRKNDSCSF